MPFNKIEEIIEDFREGKMVIITDDESRENEGDLIFPAEAVTPEKVNFLATHGRGLICIPMSEEKIIRLGLKDMVEKSEDNFKTAFTVSVDARIGITTGISAFDRSRTIEVLADPNATQKDINMPGHIFPLKSKAGGVLIRSGHTEAATDLARLAGFKEGAVICEIMSKDGSMARTPELLKFAKKHKLKIGTISSLIQYRRKYDKLIEKVSEAMIPTQFGDWKILCYRSLIDGREHIALVKGDVGEEPILVRVHSECFTGDVLGSLRCDCSEQLHTAMGLIQTAGKGVLIYMRQEGRGIGLANKLKAYHLQDKGYDTVEANKKLGFKPDLREYGTGAQILVDLGVRRMRLITNNPRKIVGLEGYGLEMIERVSLEMNPHEYNARYLSTKKEKLGHLLNFMGHEKETRDHLKNELKKE